MDLENEEDMAKIQSSFHRRGKLNEGKQMNVVQHPGIVRLYKCWYHSQNRAVFFLYEYYAGAVTLAEWTRLQLEGNAANFIAIPESILWSILTQLVSAVRAVHRGKLACRTLELQHILVTPDIASGVRSDVPMDATNDASSLALATKRVRVRINCVGVMDALEYEARKQLIDLQKKDLKDLGHILLSLATGSPKFMEYSVMLQYESFMRQNYSSRLCDITKALLTLDFAEVPTIDHVCRWLTEYTFDELDTYHSLTDSMEEALAAEYDSSRVLRLMMKLAFVNERPEFGVDSRWSETGDNYVLKLFRDYGMLRTNTSSSSNEQRHI
jgi:PAB-dependent poly(A)-specific ribonuclease subunit 3